MLEAVVGQRGDRVEAASGLVERHPLHDVVAVGEVDRVVDAAAEVFAVVLLEPLQPQLVRRHAPRLHRVLERRHPLCGEVRRRRARAVQIEPQPVAAPVHPCRQRRWRHADPRDQPVAAGGKVSADRNVTGRGEDRVVGGDPLVAKLHRRGRPRRRRGVVDRDGHRGCVLGSERWVVVHIARHRRRGGDRALVDAGAVRNRERAARRRGRCCRRRQRPSTVIVWEPS